MSEYTKKIVTMQYTEVVFYKDGEEIFTERQHDDHSYESEGPIPMTEDEIEDYA